MMVNIPVKLVCEGCVNCPDIEIACQRMDYSYEDTSYIENSFYCKNYKKCTMMANYLIREETNK